MIVVDISDHVAGGFCTKLLAASGIQAIAFESSIQPAGGVGADPALRTYLRNGVDICDESDLADHLAVADIVISSANTDRHHVEHNATNQSQVHVVIDSFNADGAYGAYRGSPLIDWASGGFLYITGRDDRPPLAGPRYLPSYLAGYAAAAAVEVALAALAAGSSVDPIRISTMEVMASLHQNSFSQFAATGGIKRRRRHPQAVYPMDIFRCRDGWACVAVVTEAQYDAFATLVGETSLLVDARFQDAFSRAEHADEFDSVVGAWFQARTVQEVVDQLQKHHVPAVQMATPSTIFDDQQLLARDFWVTSAPTDGSTGRMPGKPWREEKGTQLRSRQPTTPQSSQREPETGNDQLPLSNVVVLDLTEYWSGPSCTRFLADFGATVIRVERLGARWQAHPSGPFQDWKMNRGKLSVSINLKTGEGAALVKELASCVDVVVENFRPGVLERLGLGHQDLAGEDGPLVYLSLSGFGQTGPQARWASFGPILESASSIQSRTRYEDDVPMLLGHSLPDPVGGLLGAYVALSALRRARSDGRSRFVDLSQLEAYVAISGEELLRISAGIPTTTEAAFSGVFATVGDDEWVAIEAPTEHDRESLCRVLHLAPADGDLRQAVAIAVASIDKFEVARNLQGAGVPAFPVMTVEDLANDEDLRESGYLVRIPTKERVGMMPGIAFRGIPHRDNLERLAPACGEHSRYVLETFLQLSEEDVDALIARRVVDVAP